LGFWWFGGGLVQALAVEVVEEFCFFVWDHVEEEFEDGAGVDFGLRDESGTAYLLPSSARMQTLIVLAM